MQHTSSNSYHVIYKDPNRYAGWPANYGMWGWGNEIVLMFTSGFPDQDGGFHARDRSQPFVAMQARSLDGGETWSVCEAPLAFGVGLGAHEHLNPSVLVSLDQVIFEPPKSLDMSSPNFAVMCGKTGLREGAISWFYASNDRCENWIGPFALPMFEQLGIAARTDWLINGPRSAIVLLTSTKSDGNEGRVFACKTEDGGASFEFVSWINEFPDGYNIMPSSVRLEDGDIVTAIRSKGSKRNNCWVDIYKSDNNGKTWKYVAQPVPDTGEGGNPGSLIKLNDQRLVMTYGSRKTPYGIFAVISENGGDLWSDPILLRESFGNHDIGYTRSVLREDGKVVTAYYINDDPNAERFIEATITEF